MQLKYQPTTEDGGGYNKIVDTSSGLKFIEEFGVINLAENESWGKNTGQMEAAVILLKGSCIATVGDKKWQMERHDLFKELPFTIFLPRKTPISIFAKESERLYLWEKKMSKLAVLEKKIGKEM
jgi:5-deoxy-D-glucuronate isomerase